MGDQGVRREGWGLRYWHRGARTERGCAGPLYWRSDDRNMLARIDGGHVFARGRRGGVSRRGRIEVCVHGLAFVREAGLRLLLLWKGEEAGTAHLLGLAAADWLLGCESGGREVDAGTTHLQLQTSLAHHTAD